MGPGVAAAANSSSHDPSTTTKKGSSDNNDCDIRSLKKSTDSDLKGSVIEFMKARPFLWNKRHPGYKDHKKRDQEFQQFSTKIGSSVREIKRVWHVLRTNFFRAHKILSDKPNCGQAAVGAQNGTEKVWKYYTAMLYVLEGSNLGARSRLVASSSNADINNSSIQSLDDRTNCATKRTSSRLADNLAASSNKGNLNGMNEAIGKIILSKNGLSITSADTSNVSTPTSKLSTYNESLLDEDDDFLYARSLSLTLRKFDPTTKEVVKLKFQEIIVDYMQQLQRQQQRQPQPRQNYHQPQHQLSQLEPPPPSEIASMEASLAVKKQRISANEVT